MKWLDEGLEIGRDLWALPTVENLIRATDWIANLPPPTSRQEIRLRLNISCHPVCVAVRVGDPEVTRWAYEMQAALLGIVDGDMDWDEQIEEWRRARDSLVQVLTAVINDPERRKKWNLE